MPKINSIRNEQTTELLITDIEIQDGVKSLTVTIRGDHNQVKIMKEIERAVARAINKPQKEELSIYYAPMELRPVFIQWIEYKKARKQGYKTNESLKLCFDKLYKFSSGDAKIAQEIINEAMSNNWAGFFEPKQKKQDGNKQQISSLKEQYRGVLSATTTENNNGLPRIGTTNTGNNKKLDR